MKRIMKRILSLLLCLLMLLPFTGAPVWAGNEIPEGEAVSDPVITDPEPEAEPENGTDPQETPDPEEKPGAEEIPEAGETPEETLTLETTLLNGPEAEPEPTGNIRRITSDNGKMIVEALNGSPVPWYDEIFDDRLTYSASGSNYSDLTTRLNYEITFEIDPNAVGVDNQLYFILKAEHSQLWDQWVGIDASFDPMTGEVQRCEQRGFEDPSRILYQLGAGFSSNGNRQITISLMTSVYALMKEYEETYSEDNQIADISISIFLDGVGYFVLDIRDRHVMEVDSGWIDYDTLTLDTLIGPEFFFGEECPAVTSLSGTWYTIFATECKEWDDSSGNWMYPDAVPIPDGYDLLYFFDEASGSYASRFEKLFGSGMNHYEDGPENTAPRGPDNYVYGIAANTLRKTGTGWEDLRFTMSELIDSSNYHYFNSLPGLSNYDWCGYYTEEEIAEMWDSGEETDFPLYFLQGAAVLVVEAAFTDGVMMRFPIVCLRGMDGEFHVTGEPADVPVATPDYVLVVPADKTITSGTVESQLGLVKILPGDDFPDNGFVAVYMESDYVFSRIDGQAGTIPYVLNVSGKKEDFLAGNLSNLAPFSCFPDGTPGAVLSVYVQPEDWYAADRGDYESTVTFTSKYKEH